LHAEDSAGGYTPDDSLAILYLPRLPADKVMKAAIISPATLLQLDRAELRRRCKDKVVVLANCLSVFKDEFETAPDGRSLPKSYGHALAIETMLQRSPTIRSPGPFIEYAATFLAGAVGFGLAYAFPGRAWLALGISAGCGFAMFALSLASIRLGGPLFNPVVPIGTLMIAAGASALLPEALRRMSA
jgi:CHASE2 domain-containing sensor protein